MAAIESMFFHFSIKYGIYYRKNKKISVLIKLTEIEIFK